MKSASNTCIFQGRVSSDVQIASKNGPSGQFETARFSIAVDRALTQEQRQAAKNGDQSVKTCDFVDLEVTGAKVEFVKNYIQKGKGVMVVCHYAQWSYLDQQSGQTKYGHNFIVDDIGFSTQDAGYLKNGQQGGQQQNNGGNYGGNNYGNNGYNNNGYQNNNYNNNGNNQYNNQRNNQPQPNSQPVQGFAMFDDVAQPF